MVERIRACHRKGWSRQQIADCLGIPYIKVYQEGRRLGLIFADGRKGRGGRLTTRKIPESKTPTVIAAYQAGASLSQLAGRFGVTTVTILNLLKREGIRRRLHNGKEELDPPKTPEDVLRRMYYDEQKSLSEIARVLGYPNSASVQRDMDWYGLPRRNYPEAGKAKYRTDPEFKQKILLSLDETRRRWDEGQMTWIEVACAEWLSERGYSYECQFVLPEEKSNSKHRFDFRVSGTNLLIEMDGVRWHSSPPARARDRWYNEEAERAGFLVVRITDKELKDRGKEIFLERLEPLLGGGVGAVRETTRS